MSETGHILWPIGAFLIMIAVVFCARRLLRCLVVTTAGVALIVVGIVLLLQSPDNEESGVGPIGFQDTAGSVGTIVYNSDAAVPTSAGYGLRDAARDVIDIIKEGVEDNVKKHLP